LFCPGNIVQYHYRMHSNRSSDINHNKLIQQDLFIQSGFVQMKAERIARIKTLFVKVNEMRQQVIRQIVLTDFMGDQALICRQLISDLSTKEYNLDSSLAHPEKEAWRLQDSVNGAGNVL